MGGPPLRQAWQNPYVKLVAIAGSAIVASCALYGLRAVLTPVFIAFLIAYLLDPVVDRFEARRINRTIGIFILLIMLLVALGFLVIMTTLAVRDLREIAEEFPIWLEQVVLPWLRGPVTSWLATTFGLAPDLEALLVEIRDHLATHAPRLAGPVQSFLSSALSGTLALASWMANAVLIPLFAFYLLRDFDRITARVRELVPRRHADGFVRIFRQIDETLAAFIRGQLLVMLILGILYSLGLVLFQVPLGVGIGLLAGLLSVIPYLGFMVGIGLALVMSLMGGELIWWNLMGTVVTFTVVQLLEGTFITPKVVGDKVGLHPVWVIVALMVGAQLLGVLGMLLAVPVAAVLRTLLVHGLEAYRGSEYFNGVNDEQPR
jgi:predicted PurR-regulated permease PerM